MCQMASFVLTESEVYWSPTYDSHEEIIAQHQLTETRAGQVQILRVEIVPPEDDYSLPPEEWLYRVDQDLLPAWADAVHDEARTRVALRVWYAACVVPVGTTRESVTGGSVMKVVCGTVREVRDSGTVRVVCGSGTVGLLRHSGTVREVRDSGTVITYTNSCQPAVSGQGVVIDRSGSRVKV